MSGGFGIMKMREGSQASTHQLFLKRTGDKSRRLCVQKLATFFLSCFVACKGYINLLLDSTFKKLFV